MNRARSATSVIWKSVVAAGAMLAIPACGKSSTGSTTGPVTSQPAEPVTAEPTEPEPVTAEAAPVTPVAPAAPMMITITVQSTPPGAKVYVDDEEQPRGVTPLALELEQTDVDMQIRVMHDGYQERVETVTPSDSRVVEVALDKIQPRPRPPRGGKSLGRGFVLS